jgi:hypothetical protein
MAKKTASVSRHDIKPDSRVDFKDVWDKLPVGAIIRVLGVTYRLHSKESYGPLSTDREGRKVITFHAYKQDPPYPLYVTAGWRGWGNAIYLADNEVDLDGRYVPRGGGR